MQHKSNPELCKIEAAPRRFGRGPGRDDTPSRLRRILDQTTYVQDIPVFKLKRRSNLRIAPDSYMLHSAGRRNGLKRERVRGLGYALQSHEIHIQAMEELKNLEECPLGAVR